MTEFDEPSWAQVPSRTINDEIEAFMPISPTSTRREAIIMRTLSSVLEADPQFDVKNDLQSAMKSLGEFDGDSTLANEAWEAFQSAYIPSGEGGVRSSSAQAKEYIIPFHWKIPTYIETGEPREWGRFYYMLMTNGKVDGFNSSLHQRLKSEYEALNPSNTVEELVISAVDELISEADVTDPAGLSDSPQDVAIRPYVPDMAQVFQEDLESWLDMLEDEPSALWLQTLQDLVCFHYMMYFLQLSKNLSIEYDHAREGTLSEFDPHCQPIYFGMWEEKAGQTRNFANEWNDEKLAGQVYDSWGKLVVMRVLTATTTDPDAEVDPQPLTLAEAVTETPSEFQERCREAILDEFNSEDRPSEKEAPDLVEAARRLDRAVKRYNSRKASLDSQAAYTLGYRVIRQLAEGTERKYIRVQRGGAGTNSRLNQGALRLFARLFEQQSSDGHLRKFYRYLEKRGIALDDESQEKVMEQLDQMSLLNKMSDSKEAIYVESI